MDKRLDRSQRDKVLRRVGSRLGQAGFARTKPTFFSRSRPLLVEFVHLHELTFKPRFRAHVGLRVTNDEFEAYALNGPCSDDLPDRSQRFGFGADDHSVEVCVSEIVGYVEDVAESWFHAWRGLDRLGSDAESPLDSDARSRLMEAMRQGTGPDGV